MKKIIFIHLFNDRSGSPKVLSQVICAWMNSGGRAVLYTGKQLENGFLSGLTPSHCFIPYKWTPNKFIHFGSFVLSQIYLFFALMRYWQEDVLIYVNTLMPFGAALAGKLMNKPVLYHLHETSFRPERLKSFLRGVIRLTANKIIYVSNFLQRKESFFQKKEAVVSNSLDNSFLSAGLRSEYFHHTEGQFHVLMLSSLKKYKGVDEFVEVARRFESDSAVTFKLVLNASKSEVDCYFKAGYLPKNILIVPRCVDVSAHYARASLLLSLSRTDLWVETFGLTILEALAYGVPVIAPPVGGPAELVCDGEQGFLVDSRNIDELAKKIKNLSLDRNLCERLSAKARKRALDFSQNVFEQKIISEIMSV